jgi:hypothetical protein
VAAELSHTTDGRTDMTKLVVALRNYANAPKKVFHSCRTYKHFVHFLLLLQCLILSEKHRPSFPATTQQCESPIDRAGYVSTHKKDKRTDRKWKPIFLRKSNDYVSRVREHLIKHETLADISISHITEICKEKWYLEIQIKYGAVSSGQVKTIIFTFAFHTNLAC